MTRRTSIKLLLGAGIIGMLLFWLYRRVGYSVFDIGYLKENSHLIEELAEVVIPETDSPGAKQAGVAAYIIQIVGTGELRQEQVTFVRGLRQIDGFSQRTYNRAFTACSTREKVSMLNRFENKVSSRFPIINKINRKLFGRSFIEQLKELTVEGYCTSMLGATKGLAYDYIPGRFEACIPLSPGQRAWALN